MRSADDGALSLPNSIPDFLAQPGAINRIAPAAFFRRPSDRSLDNSRTVTFLRLFHRKTAAKDRNVNENQSPGKRTDQTGFGNWTVFGNAPKVELELAIGKLRKNRRLSVVIDSERFSCWDEAKRALRLSVALILYKNI